MHNQANSSQDLLVLVVVYNTISIRNEWVANSSPFFGNLEDFPTMDRSLIQYKCMSKKKYSKFNNFSMKSCLLLLRKINKIFDLIGLESRTFVNSAWERPQSQHTRHLILTITGGLTTTTEKNKMLDRRQLTKNNFYFRRVALTAAKKCW